MRVGGHHILVVILLPPSQAAAAAATTCAAAATTRHVTLDRACVCSAMFWNFGHLLGALVVICGSGPEKANDTEDLSIQQSKIAQELG